MTKPSPIRMIAVVVVALALVSPGIPSTDGPAVAQGNPFDPWPWYVKPAGWAGPFEYTLANSHGIGLRAYSRVIEDEAYTRIVYHKGFTVRLVGQGIDQTMTAINSLGVLFWPIPQGVYQIYVYCPEGWYVGGIGNWGASSYDYMYGGISFEAPSPANADPGLSYTIPSEFSGGYLFVRVFGGPIGEKLITQGYETITTQLGGEILWAKGGWTVSALPIPGYSTARVHVFTGTCTVRQEPCVWEVDFELIPDDVMTPPATATPTDTATATLTSTPTPSETPSATVTPTTTPTATPTATVMPTFTCTATATSTMTATAIPAPTATATRAYRGVHLPIVLR